VSRAELSLPRLGFGAGAKASLIAVANPPSAAAIRAAVDGLDEIEFID
jgi:hypothetical protein